MADIAVILSVLVATAAVLAVATFLMAQRRGLKRNAFNGHLPASVGVTQTGGGAEAESVEDEQVEEVLVLPTDRPNEVYLFGPTTDLEHFGPALATAPPQLARYATGLRSGVEAGRSFGEMSGRLVLVDDKTAAALRAGTMMRDKAGEILAHTKRADGKIASVTRLRQVGGLAAGAASLTGVMSAMAMQAQLDRIERQLSALAEGLDTVNREQLRQWHAQTLGAQDMLREVYDTASSAGELTPSNWAQIASIGHVVRTQINGDRDRLAAAVAELEALATARDVKQRVENLQSKVDAIGGAHAALTESTRTWAQYSALRLWHFTVTGDPTLEAYRQELHTFIANSHEAVEPLRLRSSDALRQIILHGRMATARHPIAVRRLPGASKDRHAALEALNWRPLALRSTSIDLELFVGPGSSTNESDRVGGKSDGE